MSVSLSNPYVPQIENKSILSSSILDLLPALVFYIDQDFCFRYINQSFEARTGIKKEFAVGRQMKEVLDADLIERLKEYTDKALSGINAEFETELSFNGIVQSYEVSFQPDIDDVGYVKGCVALIRQLPEKKILFTANSHDEKLCNNIKENAIKESEEHFYKIADSAPVMIWMAGPDKLCNFLNKSWLEFTGRSLKQEIGNGWVEGIHPDDLEYCFETYFSAFDRQAEFNMKYRLRRFDGEYRWVLDIGRPRFSPEGVFNGYIGSCIDVNDNKLMAEALEKEVELRTEELQIANHQLLRYNEELEQFAYAASHDLQEPLRKIQTFAGMLVERNFDQLNEAGKNYLSKIIKSTERMSGIIDDLLYYSRQTRMDELFEETDLSTIVENVVSDLELVIQQKGAKIEYGMLPCMKMIPSQTNRLFYNLINNSLKFSNPAVPPRITISAKKHFLSDNVTKPAFIELLVQDNGIGFEQKYADRIFQLFQRLNDKHSYDGNGIGLALCKKIVQNHNGDIFAKGEPNSGATFHIRFPASILVEEKAASIC